MEALRAPSTASVGATHAARRYRPIRYALQEDKPRVLLYPVLFYNSQSSTAGIAQLESGARSYCIKYIVIWGGEECGTAVGKVTPKMTSLAPQIAKKHEVHMAGITEKMDSFIRIDQLATDARRETWIQHRVKPSRPNQITRSVKLKLFDTGITDTAR
jgi:hypothetical protein